MIVYNLLKEWTEERSTMTSSDGNIRYLTNIHSQTENKTKILSVDHQRTEPIFEKLRKQHSQGWPRTQILCGTSPNSYFTLPPSQRCQTGYCTSVPIRHIVFHHSTALGYTANLHALFITHSFLPPALIKMQTLHISFVGFFSCEKSDASATGSTPYLSLSSVPNEQHTPGVLARDSCAPRPKVVSLCGIRSCSDAGAACWYPTCSMIN
mmetsp:Transcript_10690/g.39967  ORF Transcript_10690/g.39967 Transcript_10690/m.39967 type:complete len:209 (-) Transcript_10690:5184-5810(-)